jgi:F-type H+-transporting ATPase subunit epsilon
MAATIEFDLVAPEAVILAEPVEMVVLPGVEGDFGVLPRHAPLVSSLRPGLITVYDRQGGSSSWQPRQRIFVAAGFAEVTPERVTVLAEDASPLEQLDRVAVQRDLEAAREALEDAEDAAGRARAKRAIAVAEAKLAALKG